MENWSLLRSNEADKPQPLSTECLEPLKKWLAVFGEHFRQPISELSAVAYQVGMEGLDCSPEDIEAGCIEALKESEFMPTVAQIRRLSGLARLQRQIRGMDQTKEESSPLADAKYEKAREVGTAYREKIYERKAVA